jgi:protein-S-isoprenylcysteine O-methyltransferase Ste14
VIGRALRWLGGTALFAGLVLGVSGRWTDPFLLAYAAVWSGVALLAVTVVDPAVARERFRKGPAGVDPWSPPLFRVLGLGHLVLGALDVGRFHWTDGVPTLLRVVGLVVMAGAFAFTVRAVSANPFFIPAVRIQTERGHRLVSGGPYTIVRHPGYAGVALGVPASALALGSWAALAAALVMAVLVVRRARLEDRFLLAQLPGYAAYAARVRYRLIPRVW